MVNIAPRELGVDIAALFIPENDEECIPVLRLFLMMLVANMVSCGRD
ncbi:hypothetical protein [Escherichia coli]|nr:hypothetical protein [Escherichia coli]UPZ11625.1 hypothetical protein MYF75_05050 [Escherichia coli]